MELGGPADQRFENVPVTLPNGDEIFVRVQVQGMEEVGGRDQLRRFSDLTDQLRLVSETIASSLGGLDLDSVEVEFSVAASVKSGRLTSVLFEGGLESSMTVRLGWDAGKRNASST